MLLRSHSDGHRDDGRGTAVREFVANLPAKRPVLRKAQVMRVGGRATAKLFGDEPDMFRSRMRRGSGWLSSLLSIFGASFRPYEI
jgi:hypothetical protein